MNLPEAALADLTSLLQFLRVEFAVPNNGGDRNDYLPPQFTQVLDASVKIKEGIAFSASATACVSGIWLSQWRVRKAIVCTTAFLDITTSVCALKDFNIKDMRGVTEEEKQVFLLNLFNLMSLHASILLPWPGTDDRAGRFLWQRNVRYRLGGGFINLLQLEHGLLRACSKSLDLPSFPSSDILIPAAPDVKAFVQLQPIVPEPRVSFVLSLPHRSSPVALVFRSAGNLSHMLKTASSEYLSGRVFYQRNGSILPKVLRMFRQDFERWHAPPCSTSGPSSSTSDGTNRNKSSDPPAASAFSSSSIDGTAESAYLIDVSGTSPANTSNVSQGNPSSPSKRSVGASGTAANSSNVAVTSSSSSSAAASAGAGGGGVGVGGIGVVNRLHRSPVRAGEGGGEGYSTSSTEGGAAANDFGNPYSTRRNLTTERDLAGEDWQDSSSSSSSKKGTGGGAIVQQGDEKRKQVAASPILAFGDHRGDTSISELYLARLAMKLRVGVDVRDRKKNMRTYKSVFLGSDAVKCFLAGGDAAHTLEAIGLLDLLIEWGYIAHTTGTYWAKDQDLFYTFTGYEPAQPPLSPYLSVITAHVGQVWFVFSCLVWFVLFGSSFVSFVFVNFLFSSSSSSSSLLLLPLFVR